MAKIKIKKMGKTPAALSADKKSADQKEEMEVERWQERIRLAAAIKKAWVRKFQCDKGWDWYEGYQGANAHLLADPEQDRYIINLIYPTIEVKIPSLYFHNPKATVVPRQSREDDPDSDIQARAQIREDTVNTFMSDPRMRMKKHTNLSLKESFFYFGVVRVGYEADYIVNPNYGKPILDGDTGKALLDDDGETPLTQPQIVPSDESVYVRRIPPQNFLVSARAEFILENCDWCGYFEWVYASDLKKDPNVINRDKIKASGKFSDDYTGKIDLGENYADGFMSTEEVASKTGMVKVWCITNIRSKEEFWIPDSGKFYLKKPQAYEVFPYEDLKYHERKEGYYPMPPHFNWLSPQAEINDTRQMQRIHRKRMVRRYQMYKNSIDVEERAKLESGGDGTIVETNVPVPAIIPIEDAPLDFSVTRNVPQSKEDLMDITATGSDQRQGGGNGPETATEATVVETRARIRESYGQEIIATWITGIARKLLQTIEAHVQLPFIIKRNVDPTAPGAIMESMEVAFIWQEVLASEMGDLNYDVSVAAESLSPVNEDVERAKFSEVMLTLSSNLNLMLMYRTSDALLRKFLNLYGMRNEKIVQQVKLALEVVLLANTGGASGQLPSDQGKSGENAQKTAASGGGGGGNPGGGGGGGGLTLPPAPPATAQLRGQIGLPS